jgi:hypothetical protein
MVTDRLYQSSGIFLKTMCLISCVRGKAPPQLTKMNQSQKQLLLEARKEHAVVVAGHRISLLGALDEVDEDFGGKDDYQASLLAIVNHYGEAGVNLTKVRQVLPDSFALADAVEKLKATGKIIDEKMGRTSILRPKAVDLETMKSAKAVEVTTE